MQYGGRKGGELILQGLIANYPVECVCTIEVDAELLLIAPM